MTRSDLINALAHPNVQALLAVIRTGETNLKPEAYRMMFGGELFYPEREWKHPNRAVTIKGLTSTAAGAFQFLHRTWAALERQYGFEDFSPSMQDLGAVALIAGRKALEPIKAGRFHEALRLLGREWASLPGSPYGQPTLTLERARATYLEAGGTITDEPQQTAPEVKPMGAALLAFLPQLLPLIPSLGQLFGSGSEVQKRNIAAATVVGDALVKATNAVNVQDAVEKIQSDPDTLNAARDVVHELLPQLVEGGGGGIDGARKFAADHENSRYGRILEVVSYSALFFLLLANCMAFAIGWFKGDWGRMEAVIQADIGVALMVFGFFVGSSLSSKRKDERSGAQ